MNKFIMIVGLPASGKSTYAKKLSIDEKAIIHSSDALRKELFGDINNNDNNDVVFAELHKRIKNDLIEGKNIIYDACNISHKRRKAFLEELKKTNCEKICCLIATPYEKCLNQNKERERFVPEHVIKKMYLNFYIPQYYEGWSDIRFIWNDNEKYSLKELFHGENGLIYIDQNNHHHTLTIGEHCLHTKDFMQIITNDNKLIMAALLHDIGKKETKEFKNYKGKITSEAHYYQHHLVSVYNAMFYLHALEYPDEYILEICNYIQWHMQPFFLETEKQKEKFCNLIGQEYYDNIMALHEADMMAH